MVGTTTTTNENIEPFSTRDDILKQQLESVIDHELHELGFANLCKKIAFKVVEKVQKIDKEHDEIKSIYGELGTRLANLLVESDNDENDSSNCSNSAPPVLSQNIVTSIGGGPSHNDKCVIIIDDDDEPIIKENTPVTIIDNCSEFCVSSHSTTSTSSKSLISTTTSILCELPHCNSSTTISVFEESISKPQQNSPSHSNKESSPRNGDTAIPVVPEVMEVDEHCEFERANVPSDEVEKSNVPAGEMVKANGSSDGINSVNVTSYSNDQEGNLPTITQDSDMILRSDPCIDADLINPVENIRQIQPVLSEQLELVENVETNLDNDAISSSQDVSDTLSLSATGKLPEYITDTGPPENRSPLIMKIQKETPKTSETTSKYSSVMISHSKDKPSNCRVEANMMNENCNNNKAKKKPFKFVEGTLVYAKPCGSDIWYEAELLKEIVSVNKKQVLTKYQVRFMGGQRLQQKILLKSIATKENANIDEVKLGTRIVAGRPSDTVNSTISKKYKDISSGNNINVMFAGVVAELACEANRYRFLVFFDDGYAQYFNLSSLFLVVKPSYLVWNDVAEDCQEFIKEYLQEYPYRPLVVTSINNTMQTEWNGEWWKSKVVSIDASLVKILFDVDKRSEWIYRGTTRLEPLYNHFTAPNPPKKKKKTGKTKEDTYVDEKITHPQFGVCKYSLKDPDGILQRKEWNLPDVTFKRISSGNGNPVLDLNTFSSATEDDDHDRIMPKKLRIQAGVDNVGKEKEPSTISSMEAFGVVGALQMSPTAASLSSVSLAIVAPPKKAVEEIISTIETKVTIPAKPIQHVPFKSPVIKPASPEKRGPHACDPSCIRDRKKLIDEHRHGIFNYLSIPFKLGWKRESSKKKTGWHRDIYYRSPCNRRLRNLSEVTTYLLMTKCVNVCIDMFCFQSSISCRNQPLKPKPPLAKIDDLSGGKETCPIVCVNEMNEELPNPIVYISNRLKAEDVSINTDPGFLVCCDCTDNCQDKSKCGCAQLTIETSNAIDNAVNQNAGYQYRRLRETITTGIYECNQNCSCYRETCYNRVVQNGIQLRLQVFMTENRGWGLRCVDDIPKGTFICTYTGQVLNEQTANREGMDFGDEYLAELDHIEVVEKAKEDYESDVPELRENISISSDSDSDSDSDVLSISSDSDSNQDDDSQKDNNDKKVPEVIKTSVASVSETSNTNSNDSSITENSSADVGEEKPLAPCHVPILRIPSTDLPVRLDSTSGDSTSDEQPGSPNIDFSLSSPVHNVPTVTSEANTPFSYNIAAKKLPTIPEVPTAIAHAIGDQTTFSGKAVAIKSTANKAYAHKSTGGKRSEKLPIIDGHGKLHEKKADSNTISTRSLYDGDKQMYVIDAKCFGNVGRFMNHSCSPNLFVQNIMVDTHDLRFPWVAFFAQQNIQSYTELTWDYNYEIGSVPGKTMLCKCGAKNCKGRLL